MSSNNLCADRISNLPIDITYNILQRLSLREAAKTSILSKSWRFIWASIPQIKLDEPFFVEIISNGIALKSYSNVVNNIVVGHIGPIVDFELYIPEEFPNETDMWIRYVCANGVKKLFLEYSLHLQKTFPSFVYSCSGLTHLTVKYCKLLSLPSTFTGFPSLIHLNLGTSIGIRPRVDLKVLEFLISGCPKLESLFLILYEVNSLTIYAPKLKHLFVGGFLSDLCLQGSKHINTLHLKLTLLQRGYTRKFFNCMASIEKLILSHQFWRATKNFKSPKKFTEDLGQLRTVHLIEMPLYSFSHSSISFALSLFMSSPLLERLHVEVTQAEVHHEVAHNDDSIQIDCSCTLQCLRTVNLINILGSSNELHLLEFLLAHSPVLEDLTIRLNKYMEMEDKFNFVVEATQFPRASPNAKIMIKMKI